VRLCVDFRRDATDARLLRFSEDPRDESFASCTIEGSSVALTVRDDWKPDEIEFLSQELRRPEVLVGQIGPDRPGVEASELRAWQIATLYLKFHDELRARDYLGRRSDSWVGVLLLLARARASTRILSVLNSGKRVPWLERCRNDLLEAAGALDFFEHKQTAAFAQWLAGALAPERAPRILNDLFPPETTVLLAAASESQELRVVLFSVARALRRNWFLGRYDLRGAATLHRLLARLQWYRRPGLKWLRHAIMTAGTLLIPRLAAGCLIGILPFLITDEAWRVARGQGPPLLAAVFAATCTAVLFYLLYDQEVADPARLVSRWQAARVWITAVIESLALAAAVQLLAAGSFPICIEPLTVTRFDWGVFWASAAFSLGVGVFTQIIWQDQAVTAPP
jgi:hypothetical protein